MIICGIYPDNLTLQYTGADPTNLDLFHTLDITIVSSAAYVSNAQGGVDQVVKSVTTLHDKPAGRRTMQASLSCNNMLTSPAPCL
jgi:hypothetical protein